jgi:diamine N-acetyltransferase
MPISPENIEIKKAGSADARLIFVLATATFYEAYFEQDDPHDLANYIFDSFNADSVSEQIADPAATFFIAYHDGHGVGYVKLVAGSREPCITANKVIELKRIYLIERVWRKGVGEVLLRHCIDEARRMGMDSIWLGVWQMNARALPFYEKHGFVKVGTLEFPYGDSVGINDVMELRLSGQTEN